MKTYTDKNIFEYKKQNLPIQRSLVENTEHDMFIQLGLVSPANEVLNNVCNLK